MTPGVRGFQLNKYYQIRSKRELITHTGIFTRELRFLVRNIQVWRVEEMKWCESRRGRATPKSLHWETNICISRVHWFIIWFNHCHCHSTLAYVEYSSLLQSLPRITWWDDHPTVLTIKVRKSGCGRNSLVLLSLTKLIHIRRLSGSWILKWKLTGWNTKQNTNPVDSIISLSIHIISAMLKVTPGARYVTAHK